MTFAVEDLRNRYRNSILGVIWTILEPLLMLSVLYFVFANILKTDIPNFAIYLLLGLIFWNFLSNSTRMSIDSISTKKEIISNIYFMRSIPALSSNITALLMMGIEFLIFTSFLIIFNVIPGFPIILLPFFILIQFIICLGLSLPLSVLSVSYKDIKFIWNVVLSAGFFLHPILYTMDILPEKMQHILFYVPTVRLLELFHESVLSNSFPDVIDLSYVIMTSIIILISGYMIYKKFENKFVEEL